jgi:hypothetical protein
MRQKTCKQVINTYAVRRRFRAFVNLLRGRPPSLPMRLNSSGGSFARALPPRLANSVTVSGLVTGTS